MKTAVQSWRRFWRLDGSARRMVVEAAATLAITRAGLLLAGFRRLKAAMEWLTPAAAGRGATAGPREMALARTIACWERAAARHLPFEKNCLDRSLTLWWLLRRRGIAADLRIGGRKKSGRFEAHAWVEVGDVVLEDGSGLRREFRRFEKPVAGVEKQARGAAARGFSGRMPVGE